MLNAEISANLSRSYNSTKTQKHNKKTLLLIAILFLTSLISYAQTEKGSQTFGLNLGFNYNKTSGAYINPYDNSSSDAGVKTTAFNIGPSYSYFVSDKLIWVFLYLMGKAIQPTRTLPLILQNNPLMLL